METTGTDGFLCCLLLFLCFLGTSNGVVSLGTKDWAGESCFSRGKWSLGMRLCSGLVGGLEIDWTEFGSTQPQLVFLLNIH